MVYGHVSSKCMLHHLLSAPKCYTCWILCPILVNCQNGIFTQKGSDRILGDDSSLEQRNKGQALCENLVSWNFCEELIDYISVTNGFTGL